MKSEKVSKNGGNKPDIRLKVGVFQLSAWKRTRVIPAKNDFDVEREYEEVNVCLSTGVRRNNEWKNVSVWFKASQFGDLKQVVDDFGEKLKQLNCNELELEGLE